MARVGFPSLGALSLIFVANSAYPAEPGTVDQELVRELLRSAATATKNKRWDACIAALTKVVAMQTTPTAVGDLGVCEERAGKPVEAYDHLRHAMDAVPSPPASEPWTSYKASMARVLDRVAVVWITVYPRDAEVSLDGQILGRADGRSFAVEPGERTLRARLDGYDDAVRSLTVRGGDVPHVELILTAKPKAEAPAPTPVPPPPPSVPVAKPKPTVVAETSPVPAPFRWCIPRPTLSGVLAPSACAAFATALASGGVAIGLEVDRKSLRDGLTSGACSPSAPSRAATCDALAERATQRNIALDMLFGAALTGGVLAAAARVAFGFERSTTTPTIAATATGSGGAIVLLGAW